MSIKMIKNISAYIYLLITLIFLEEKKMSTQISKWSYKRRDYSNLSSVSLLYPTVLPSVISNPLFKHKNMS